MPTPSHILRTLLLVCLAASLVGCPTRTPDDDDDDTGDPTVDADADGFFADVDCDGAIDDDAVDAASWFVDVDGDGLGDTASQVVSCDPPQGTVPYGGDCDDGDPAIHPGADELCDGADQDCDSLVDEDAPGDAVSYGDVDGDGYGTDADVLQSCVVPSGRADVAGDCDDNDPDINPGAVESCNAIDDDCDFEIDEDLDSTQTWYPDADGDTWGDEAAAITTCTTPADHVLTPGDCDDTVAAINPNATEACEDVADNDCDGLVDEGCPVDHCGDIVADEVWASSSIHTVTCDVQIGGAGSPVVTIQDGAVVSFEAGTRLLTGVAGPGRLEIEGDVLGVTFTSAETFPDVGDWQGIGFWPDDSGSVLSGLTIEYGGSWGSGNLRLFGADVTVEGVTSRYSASSGLFAINGAVAISDSTFVDNSDWGVELASSGELAPGASPSFVGNTMTGNGLAPIVLPPAQFDRIDGASCSFVGNGDDRIELLDGALELDTTWVDPGVPLHVTGDLDIGGVASPVVTFAEGLELQFDPATELEVGGGGQAGELSIPGGSANVVLTSAEPSPVAGDWDGLVFAGAALDSSLTEVTIQYAGGANDGAIDIEGDLVVTLAGSTIENSDQAGIHAANGELAIFGTFVRDNGGIGIDLDGGILELALSSTFGSNWITGNGGVPIRLGAESVGRLDALSSYAPNADDRIAVVGGTVDVDATWHGIGTPLHIQEDIYVDGGTSPELVIEDGLQLQFDPGVAFWIGLGDPGSLEVAGSSAGVVFTSSAAVPAPGDWGGLKVWTAAGPVHLEGLTLEYAGYDEAAAVRTQGPGRQLELVDSTVRHCSANGLYLPTGELEMHDSTIEAVAGDAIVLGASAVFGPFAGFGVPLFTGNTVTGNGGAALVGKAGVMGSIGSGNDISGNGDGVLVEGGAVESSGVWQALNAPYRITADVTVGHSTSPVLTVGAGATLQFDAGTGITVGGAPGGMLTGSGVLFTTSDPSPAAGQWDGITFSANCLTTDSQIFGSTVEYGGGNGYGNVRFQGCSGSLFQSQMAHSAAWGVYIDSGATPALTEVLYEENAFGDVN